MGFLGAFFKKRTATDRMAGSGYRFYFGQTDAGKIVNERSAMQMTAVYACVRILAESIASLPLHVYARDGNGNMKKAEDHPLYFLLHDEPNPEMDSFIFRETLMTHILLWGNAYSQIIRNGKGEIVALYPLMPGKMSVERDEKGQLYYRYNRMGDEPPTMDGGTVILMPEDVLHIPGLGFDGLVGYSPISMTKNAIGLALAAEEYGSRFFSNGAAPAGVLEHPGVIKDVSKLRESWNETFGGSRNAGKVAILEEGLHFNPISMSPQDSQLLETRQYQLNEIARIFRIPPHMLADLSKATFSNIENQSLDFVKYTLDPWVNRWEKAMQRSLLNADEKRRYEVRFNVDGLLRGDYKSRMEGYAVGINNGFMCPNDVRRLEGWDLIPAEKGGDEFLIQGAMIKLADAGIYADKDGNSAKEGNYGGKDE